jgi:hypothetical protein
MKKLITLVAVLLLAVYVSVFPAKAGSNKYGVAVSQYYSERGFSDSSKWKEHLDWAANMVGNDGHVKLFFPWIGEPDAPVETYKQVVQETYARNLNPIVRVQGNWVNSERNLPDLTGCWARPPQDSGRPYSLNAGSYEQYSQKIVDFVDSLPTPPQGRTLYIELWNEMNYDSIEWCDESGNSRAEPENYARFYIEVYNRMSRLGKPNIKLTNGGLGRAGSDRYLQGMLTEMYKTVGQNPSTLKDLLEYFSIHVYPAPESEQRFLDNMEFYKSDLNIFSQFGIDPNSLKVLVTEGGYIRRVSAQEDALQAKLDVELAKRLSSDPRIIAINFFSLDDYTDRTISPLPSPLDTTLLVRPNSGTSNGMPTDPRPAYTSLKQLMNGTNTCQNCGSEQQVKPIGYAVSEDAAAVNSLQAPLVYANFPTTIDYSLKNTTPGQKVIYVKYFYSNGRSRLETVELTFEPQIQAKVCNPGETQSMCKQTQCSVGQQVTNPSDVLGVQIAANCAGGQEFYSCADIKCPDGSVAPGGGCYPDNYLTDCLANCPATTPSTPLAAPTAAPVTSQPGTGGTVATQACPDQCFADELRLGVGKNSSGQCDSGFQSTSYICRAGAVGQQRTCAGSQYLCVDGQNNGFYWSQLGTASTNPAPGSTSTQSSTNNNGYQTTFRCNDQGSGWICTSASPNSCSR